MLNITIKIWTTEKCSSNRREQKQHYIFGIQSLLFNHGLEVLKFFFKFLTKNIVIHYKYKYFSKYISSCFKLLLTLLLRSPMLSDLLIKQDLKFECRIRGKKSTRYLKVSILRTRCSNEQNKAERAVQESREKFKRIARGHPQDLFIFSVSDKCVSGLADGASETSTIGQLSLWVTRTRL